MPFMDLMRGYDQLHLRVTLEIGDKDCLIFWPGTSGYHNPSRLTLSSLNETFHHGDLLRLVIHVNDPIETGVSRHGDISDAILR